MTGPRDELEALEAAMRAVELADRDVLCAARVALYCLGAATGLPPNVRQALDEFKAAEARRRAAGDAMFEASQRVARGRPGGGPTA